MHEAILNGKPPPSAERIAFWLSEIEYVQAHAPEAPPAAPVDEVVVERASEAEPTTVSPNGHKAKRARKGVAAHG